ncbi:Fe-S cluster biogenesis protein NfuA, 4Fe-4S-binding domain [Amycolatopsis xylanica]|uniref:Fe-S cluster biogenesis protein NfuA, 4Fe-4S-binding domain n=1 Tax=Amycolatopsis xylanica TaxID=589385 RepID=A0A1H3G6C5_9PSEU|nr:NifU family protein [Amycolatopsis xylanica]SDX98590.1 Fe-S cluster biogenesis protein NfuA, 4Fe-4S-binding domain [Amycolatopsis xylanica]
MDAGQVGERIEQLLGEMEDVDKAEDLVHTLMEFYGAGLARIVEIGGAPLLERLVADDHVNGLLILHDLHPRSTVERVTAALEKVRPYLGSHAGDVDLLGITGDGVLRLRLKGTCDGCPSSAVTVKYAIEKAVHDAAPEITDIEVSGAVAAEAGGRPLLPLQALECPVPAESA